MAEASAFVALLRNCAKTKDMSNGIRVHADLVRRGWLERSSFAANAVVSMYAKCGALAHAQRALDGLTVCDVFSWNALIAGYALDGQSDEAFRCFSRMQSEGLSPSAVTFTCVSKACGSIGAADKGEQIQDEIARHGFLGKDILLDTALVDMYAKCGMLAKAQLVLEELPDRDVISWNALIAGYAQQGLGEEVLNCVEQMQCEGLSPDAVSFICILKVCGSTESADTGAQIHDEIVKRGWLGNAIELGTALLDMYAKCGALADARQVLDVLPVQDVVSWSALIAGYVQQGQGEDALDCFEQMQRKGLAPNAVTFSCVLKACGSIGAVDKGEKIHDEVDKQGLIQNNIVIQTTLVDMYAKCGAPMKAQRVLEQFPLGDMIWWNTLIAAYTQLGKTEEALICFEQMQQKGLAPDKRTFSSVLNACSHSGLVDKGQMCFANMSTEYGITPDIQHYACIIDLLGRAGHFDKAVAATVRMPYPAIWSGMLASCRKWLNVNVGRWAFEHAIQEDQSDVAAHVCMANIYAAAGMEGVVESFEELLL